MKMDKLLQQAQQLKLLRPLDVQFAFMVASSSEPAVMLAAALVSRDAGEGHVCLPLSRLNPDDAAGVRRDPFWQTLFDEAGNPESCGQRRRRAHPVKAGGGVSLSAPDVAA